jgi:hypothetical protein
VGNLEPEHYITSNFAIFALSLVFSGYLVNIRRYGWLTLTEDGEKRSMYIILLRNILKDALGRARRCARIMLRCNLGKWFVRREAAGNGSGSCSVTGFRTSRARFKFF